MESPNKPEGIADLKITNRKSKIQAGAPVEGEALSSYSEREGEAPAAGYPLAGGMEGATQAPVIDVPIRVRYADTDKMGIVYYGTYPMYFEIGRSEYMREKGLRYRDLEDMGYHLVVVAMEVKYHNSAVYDDLIIVKTGISELKSRGLTFHYEVYRDGNMIVEGKTKHICVNANKKPVLLPSHLLAFLKDVKLPAPEGRGLPGKV